MHSKPRTTKPQIVEHDDGITTVCLLQSGMPLDLVGEETELVDASPQTMENLLAYLIKRYIQKASKFLANRIVLQLEYLLQHPDCIGYPNERCGYKKMLLQWKLIARAV